MRHYFKKQIQHPALGCRSTSTLRTPTLQHFFSKNTNGISKKFLHLLHNDHIHIPYRHDVANSPRREVGQLCLGIEDVRKMKVTLLQIQEARAKRPGFFFNYEILDYAYR